MERNQRTTVQGTVTSTKTAKTITVLVVGLVVLIVSSFLPQLLG